MLEYIAVFSLVLTGIAVYAAYWWGYDDGSMAEFRDWMDLK